MSNGQIKSLKLNRKQSFSCPSLLQELKEKAKTLNVSTHPIFQNFSSNKSQTKNDFFPEFILTAEIENGD